MSCPCQREDLGLAEQGPVESCGCDDRQSGGHAESQAEHNLRWGLLAARTRPGASDFWAACTALEVYERGPRGSSPQETEARIRMDEFARMQHIAIAARSSTFDSRYTEAVRTTGLTTMTVPSHRYGTFTPGVFLTRFEGGTECCPLSITWTRSRGRAEADDARGFPTGVVSGAGGNSFSIDQEVEAKWSDAGACDCACCEFRIYVAFYIRYFDAPERYKTVDSADLRKVSKNERGVPKAGSGATTTHRTPASSLVFVSDAEFSDGSNPLKHAEVARDDPDNDAYFSKLNSLGATEAGANDDQDTEHGPCYAKWQDVVRYPLPDTGWVYFLFQFLAVIRPTAQCGGKPKWKMKEYSMLVRVGSPPDSSGLTITETEP